MAEAGREGRRKNGWECMGGREWRKGKSITAYNWASRRSIDYLHTRSARPSQK